MLKNGRNQNQLVAELLEVLSEQVNRLRADNKSLQAEVDRLRLSSTPPAEDYPALMHFLDGVAAVCARHPDGAAALAYFVLALKRARGWVI